MSVAVQITRLPHSDGLPLPRYATAGSVGMDVYAAVDAALTVAPGACVLVPTGLSVALPADYEFQVRPRSGLALNKSVTVGNSPGTIDDDFRGQLQIILINHGVEDFIIHRGDRIAQLVLAPVVRARWDEVDALPLSRRGDGGFGSTGT